MDRTKEAVLGIFSFLPLIALVIVSLVEPMFYTGGPNNQLVLQAGDTVRIISAAVLLAMMFYFISYTYRSADARLEGKRSLWVAVLLLGNVFAVPVFWYLFFLRKNRLHEA